RIDVQMTGIITDQVQTLYYTSGQAGRRSRGGKIGCQDDSVGGHVFATGEQNAVVRHLYGTAGLPLQRFVPYAANNSIMDIGRQRAGLTRGGYQAATLMQWRGKKRVKAFGAGIAGQ